MASLSRSTAARRPSDTSVIVRETSVAAYDRALAARGLQRGSGRFEAHGRAAISEGQIAATCGISRQMLICARNGLPFCKCRSPDLVPSA